MWCRTCAAEYVSGITRCADCGAQLVDAVPVVPVEPRRALAAHVVHHWPVALGGLLALIGVGVLTTPPEGDATLGLEYYFGGILIVVGTLVGVLGHLARRGNRLGRWALVLMLALFVPPPALYVGGGIILLGYLVWRYWSARRSSQPA